MSKIVTRGKTKAAAGDHVTRGVICALLGGICWGFSGTCAQLLMDTYQVPPLWITCVRMLVAAVFFLSITVIKDWRSLLAVMRDKRSLFAIAAFAIFGVLLTQTSYLFAIGWTDAGTATVLEQTGLVLIMFYVCFRARRFPRFKEFAGLALALLGTFVIATQGNFGSLAIPPEGLFWGLICAGALAFYTLLPTRVLKKWGAMIVTGLSMLFGGTVASTFVQPWNIVISPEPGVIAAMIAIIVVGTLGAYMLYLQGVNDAGPIKASLLCSVEPVSAMVISAVWLKTAVSVFDMFGCAMILIMVFLVTQHESSEKDLTLPVPQIDAFGKPTDPPVFFGSASELGYYTSRVACRDDYSAVVSLLDGGHKTFAALGIDEGRKKYPSARRLMHSIKNQTTYVIEDTAGRMIGMYAVSLSGDANYGGHIEGSWLTTSKDDHPTYAVLHWVNVMPEARRAGVGMFILEDAAKHAHAAGKKSIRADIYPQNIPMKTMLVKNGYSECGALAIKDYFDRQKIRIIFEKVL